ncbi:MAG: peptide chain release factor N(5)-glutamine methyltransferase [Pseudomonadota bacterium]
MTTIAALVEAIAATLRRHLPAVESRSEARRLVALATGVDRVRQLADADVQIDTDLAARAECFAVRRAAGEPYAYLVGVREFWSRDFEVGPGVLIPRRESETMIEAALKDLPPDRQCRIADLGTGSGCLLLTVLAERPFAWGIGVERSGDALAFARRNRRRLRLCDRAALIQGDWWTAVAGRFELVLANPPYVPTDELDALMVDVRDHEPRVALDGGAGGMEPHRRILEGLADRLAPGGMALLEIGHEQGPAALAQAAACGIRDATIITDLEGRDRCLRVRRGPVA